MNEKTPNIPAPVIRFNRFAATKGFDCNKVRSRTGFAVFFSWRRNKSAKERLRRIKNEAQRREVTEKLSPMRTRPNMRRSSVPLIREAPTKSI